jgi:branched-chain amino acid transport system substrate-binding protein
VVSLGAAVALSGTLANEGKMIKDGYDFWASYVNAHGGIPIGDRRYRVQIRYLDDASDPAQTTAAVERLITDDHVDFILGPYGSAETFSAAAAAERHEIPMVVSAGAAERTFNQGYRYIVDVISPARKYLVGMIEFAVKRSPHPRTVAISSASDPFSLEVQQGAVQSANDHGIHVVYADHYGDDPKTVVAAVNAIKAAHPDLILNAGHLEDAILMQRTLKEQHVQAQMYGYSIGPGIPAFLTSLGDDAEAIFGSSQWSPAVTYLGAAGFYRRASDYARAFAAVYGHEPDFHNAEASAAGLAFQYALQAAGTTNRYAVRDALKRLNVETFFGVLRFDSRGANIYKPMVVTQLQHGKLATIYPYRLANAKAEYPAPTIER